MEAIDAVIAPRISVAPVPSASAPRVSDRAVIASPVPLFADIREGHESDGDYLAALNQRLKADSTGTEGRPVTADFVFITTKPKGP